MPTIPTCTITGKAFDLKGNIIPSAPVVLSVNLGAIFIEQSDGTWQEVDGTTYTYAADNAGIWSIPQPQPLYVTPTPVFSILAPSGNTYSGAWPSVSGPLTLYDVTTNYGWKLTATKSTSSPLYYAVSGTGTTRNGLQVSALASLTTNPTVALTTAGYTGPSVSVDGLNGGITIGMLFTYGAVASDTATFTLQGTIDGTNWFTVPIAQVDGIATPLPAASLTIGGAATRYSCFQANISPLSAIRIVLSGCLSGGVSANWQSSTLSAVNAYGLPI